MRVGRATEHIRRRAWTFLEGTFPLLPGASQAVQPAAEEGSVAMRRKLNFIIALPYLMSVSQAAGDVLMKLELYSL